MALRRSVTLLEPRTRVVVLGSGWACFRFLKDIDHSKYAVSLVSPRNHMLFTPLLASASVGTVTQRAICEPVRPLCTAKNAEYFESTAESIDKASKTVTCRTADGTSFPLPYDKLVIGVGYQANDFGIKGVMEHALFMKQTGDAQRFREHVLSRLEQASYIRVLDGDLSMSSKEEAEIRKLLTFVIVGGGPTGVELAAELTDFLKSDGKKCYPDLMPMVKVHIVTMTPILETFDQAIQNYTASHLENKQKIKLHVGATVNGVEKETLKIKDANGEALNIDYGTLVWCAGIKPVPFISNVDLPKIPNGKLILTDRALRVKGEPDIYGMGDCGSIESYRLPQTAQVANQQAMYLAKQFNEAKFAQPDDFVFKPLGSMAYIGSYAGVIASALPWPLNQFTGLIGFLGWRSAYWGMQLSLRNQAMLAGDWIRSLTFGRDLTRHGLSSELDATRNAMRA